MCVCVYLLQDESASVHLTTTTTTTTTGFSRAGMSVITSSLVLDAPLAAGRWLTVALLSFHSCLFAPPLFPLKA